MQKKVFVTRAIPDAGLSLLRNAGFEVEVGKWLLPPSKEELIGTLHEGEFDAVLTLLTDTIDAEVMDAAPSVKIYANYAIGVNNIDSVAAQERGITITNAPGLLNSTCVAEHAITLMLALAGRLVEADAFVRNGKFKGWDPMIFIGTDINGKTLGLIGAGSIGGKVARMATDGLGMNVIYHDIRRNEELEKECAAVFKDTIDDVLKEADVVSLHVPLLESTRHLLNKQKLSLMKPSALLINTSRGAVIDEKALVETLQKGEIRGAGLDVFEFEPDLSAGLAELPNVILTPHIASARESARNEMAKVAAQNIIDVLEGRKPEHAVK